MYGIILNHRHVKFSDQCLPFQDFDLNFDSLRQSPIERNVYHHASFVHQNFQDLKGQGVPLQSVLVSLDFVEVALCSRQC